MQPKSIIVLLTGFMLSILMFASCEGVDGEVELPRFPSSYTFNKEGGTTVLKARKKVSWWTLSNLTINGKATPFDDDSLKIHYESPENDFFVSKIEGPWFVIEKLDSKHISVTVNETQEDRKLTFWVFLGNGREIITINQKKD